MIAQNVKGAFEFQFMHQEQVETLQSSRGQIACCNLTPSPPSPHTHTHTPPPPQASPTPSLEVSVESRLVSSVTLEL